MKKFIALTVASALLISSAVPAMADNGPIRKLGRGFANVATSPLEIMKGMGQAKEEGGIIAGMTWGLLLGAFGTVKRAAVGAYEMATFPVPIPEDYDPILDDPEFFLDSESPYGIKR